MGRKLRDALPRRLRSTLGRVGRRILFEAALPLQRPVPAGSIVAICHCHYADLVPELATRLGALPRGAVLHVTSDDPAVLERWTETGRRSRVSVHLHLTENRGRDLLPFFTVARGLSLAPETLLLKIHGKRSTYSADGDWWRRDTLRGLLPDPFAASRALERFRRDPRLALLGAPQSFVSHPVYWGRNRDGVAAVLRDITGEPVIDDDLGFVAGTMFWIRAGFLSALLPHIDADRFEAEPLGQDGSYAHAIERVIGMAALARGWHIGETDSPDPLTRDAVRHRKLRYL